MKTIVAIIAIAALVTAYGIFNVSKVHEETNDTIQFSYCNPGGTPTVSKLTDVHSLLPIKVNKNTFVFIGTVLQSVFIKKLHAEAKIGIFSKTFDQDIN